MSEDLISFASPPAAQDDRRQQIILTAYDLLDEEGLDGLTIRAVLARTGLARRAFYDRFAGKDDMVLAVFEHTLQLAADFFAMRVATLPDPLSRLNSILTGIVMGQGMLIESDMWGGERRSAALSREHMRLAESHPQELQQAIGPLIDLIAAQLQQGMAEGSVRHGDPRRIAVLIYNLVSTTVHTELIGGEGARPDRARRTHLANEIWDFCQRAISA